MVPLTLLWAKGLPLSMRLQKVTALNNPALNIPPLNNPPLTLLLAKGPLLFMRSQKATHLVASQLSNAAVGQWSPIVHEVAEIDSSLGMAVEVAFKHWLNHACD